MEAVHDSRYIVGSYGSGIQRMLDACRAAGIPEPTLSESTGGFLITFRKAAKAVDKGSCVRLAGQVTGQVQRLLESCDGELSRSELQQRLAIRHRDYFNEAYLCPALIRTFAVSRIASARILDESFKMPAAMNKKTMFGDQFGIIWKDKFSKVRIRFSAEVAPYIRERQWHPLQKIKDLRDGGLILEFTTNHLNEVKDWVLSWGPGATVMAPQPLIGKVREDLKQTTANYGRLI